MENKGVDNVFISVLDSYGIPLFKTKDTFIFCDSAGESIDIRQQDTDSRGVPLHFFPNKETVVSSIREQIINKLL